MARHRHYLGGHTLIRLGASSTGTVTSFNKIETRSIVAFPISIAPGKATGTYRDNEGRRCIINLEKLKGRIEELKYVLGYPALPLGYNAFSVGELKRQIAELEAYVSVPSERYDGRRAYYKLYEVENWLLEDDYFRRLKRQIEKDQLPARPNRTQPAPSSYKHKNPKLGAAWSSSKASKKDARGSCGIKLPKDKLCHGGTTPRAVSASDVAIALPPEDSLPLEQQLISEFRKTSISETDAARRAKVLLAYLAQGAASKVP